MNLDSNNEKFQLSSSSSRNTRDKCVHSGINRRPRNQRCSLSNPNVDDSLLSSLSSHINILNNDMRNSAVFSHLVPHESHNDYVSSNLMPSSTIRSSPAKCTLAEPKLIDRLENNRVTADEVETADSRKDSKHHSSQTLYYSSLRSELLEAFLRKTNVNNTQDVIPSTSKEALVLTPQQSIFNMPLYNSIKLDSLSAQSNFLDKNQIDALCQLYSVVASSTPPEELLNPLNILTSKTAKFSSSSSAVPEAGKQCEARSSFPSDQSVALLCDLPSSSQNTPNDSLFSNSTPIYSVMPGNIDPGLQVNGLVAAACERSPERLSSISCKQFPCISNDTVDLVEERLCDSQAEMANKVHSSVSAAAVVKTSSCSVGTAVSTTSLITGCSVPAAAAIVTPAVVSCVPSGSPNAGGASGSSVGSGKHALRQQARRRRRNTSIAAGNSPPITRVTMKALASSSQQHSSSGTTSSVTSFVQQQRLTALLQSVAGALPSVTTPNTVATPLSSSVLVPNIMFSSAPAYSSFVTAASAPSTTSLLATTFLLKAENTTVASHETINETPVTFSTHSSTSFPMYSPLEAANLSSIVNSAISSVVTYSANRTNTEASHTFDQEDVKDSAKLTNTFSMKTNNSGFESPTSNLLRNFATVKSLSLNKRSSEKNKTISLSSLSSTALSAKKQTQNVQNIRANAICNSRPPRVAQRSSSRLAVTFSKNEAVTNTSSLATIVADDAAKNSDEVAADTENNIDEQVATAISESTSNETVPTPGVSKAIPSTSQNCVASSTSSIQLTCSPSVSPLASSARSLRVSVGQGSPSGLSATPSTMQDYLAAIPGFKPRKRSGRKLSTAAQLAQSKEGNIDLETPDSILCGVNLRIMLNASTFSLLTSAQQKRLMPLMPTVDLAITKHGDVQLASGSLNNEFFGRASESWRCRLTAGEFTHESQIKMRAESEKDRSKLDPWKVAHFEPVWGVKQTATLSSSTQMIPLASESESTSVKDLLVRQISLEKPTAISDNNSKLFRILDLISAEDQTYNFYCESNSNVSDVNLSNSNVLLAGEEITEKLKCDKLDEMSDTCLREDISSKEDLHSNVQSDDITKLCDSSSVSEQKQSALICQTLKRKAIPVTEDFPSKKHCFQAVSTSTGVATTRSIISIGNGRATLLPVCRADCVSSPSSSSSGDVVCGNVDVAVSSNSSQFAIPTSKCTITRVVNAVSASGTCAGHSVSTSDSAVSQSVSIADNAVAHSVSISNITEGYAVSGSNSTSLINSVSPTSHPTRTGVVLRSRQSSISIKPSTLRQGTRSSTRHTRSFNGSLPDVEIVRASAPSQSSSLVVASCGDIPVASSVSSSSHRTMAPLHADRPGLIIEPISSPTAALNASFVTPSLLPQVTIRPVMAKNVQSTSVCHALPKRELPGHQNSSAVTMTKVLATSSVSSDGMIINPTSAGGLSSSGSSLLPSRSGSDCAPIISANLSGSSSNVVFIRKLGSNNLSVIDPQIARPSARSASSGASSLPVTFIRPQQQLLLQGVQLIRLAPPISGARNNATLDGGVQGTLPSSSAPSILSSLSEEQLSAISSQLVSSGLSSPHTPPRASSAPPNKTSLVAVSPRPNSVGPHIVFQAAAMSNSSTSVFSAPADVVLAGNQGQPQTVSSTLVQVPSVMQPPPTVQILQQHSSVPLQVIPSSATQIFSPSGHQILCGPSSPVLLSSSCSPSGIQSPVHGFVVGSNDSFGGQEELHSPTRTTAGSPTLPGRTAIPISQANLSSSIAPTYIATVSGRHFLFEGDFKSDVDRGGGFDGHELDAIKAESDLNLSSPQPIISSSTANVESSCFKAQNDLSREPERPPIQLRFSKSLLEKFRREQDDSSCAGSSSMASSSDEECDANRMDEDTDCDPDDLIAALQNNRLAIKRLQFLTDEENLQLKQLQERRIELEREILQQQQLMQQKQQHEAQLQYLGDPDEDEHNIATGFSEHKTHQELIDDTQRRHKQLYDVYDLHEEDAHHLRSSTIKTRSYNILRRNSQWISKVKGEYFDVGDAKDRRVLRNLRHRSNRQKEIQHFDYTNDLKKSFIEPPRRVPQHEVVFIGDDSPDTVETVQESPEHTIVSSATAGYCTIGKTNCLVTPSESSLPISVEDEASEARSTESLVSGDSVVSCKDALDTSSGYERRQELSEADLIPTNQLIFVRERNKITCSESEDYSEHIKIKEENQAVSLICTDFNQDTEEENSQDGELGSIQNLDDCLSNMESLENIDDCPSNLNSLDHMEDYPSNIDSFENVDSLDQIDDLRSTISSPERFAGQSKCVEVISSSCSVRPRSSDNEMKDSKYSMKEEEEASLIVDGKRKKKSDSVDLQQGRSAADDTGEDESADYTAHHQTEKQYSNCVSQQLPDQQYNNGTVQQQTDQQYSNGTEQQQTDQQYSNGTSAHHTADMFVAAGNAVLPSLAQHGNGDVSVGAVCSGSMACNIVSSMSSARPSAVGDGVRPVSAVDSNGLPMIMPHNMPTNCISNSASISVSNCMPLNAMGQGVMTLNTLAPNGMTIRPNGMHMSNIPHGAMGNNSMPAGSILHNGMPSGPMGSNNMSPGAIGLNSVPPGAMGSSGIPAGSMGPTGTMGPNGMPASVMGPNGIVAGAMCPNGIPMNGMGPNYIPMAAMGPNGMTPVAVGTNGMAPAGGNGVTSVGANGIGPNVVGGAMMMMRSNAAMMMMVPPSQRLQCLNNVCGGNTTVIPNGNAYMDASSKEGAEESDKGESSSGEDGCPCNLQAMVVCLKCGAFCHHDCITASRVCGTCLVR